MADIVVTVPNTVIPILSQAIAPEVANGSDVSAKEIATRVLLGQATTAAERSALFQAWVRLLAKDRISNEKSRVAAITARADDTEGAVSW